MIKIVKKMATLFAGLWLLNACTAAPAVVAPCPEQPMLLPEPQQITTVTHCAVVPENNIAIAPLPEGVDALNLRAELQKTFGTAAFKRSGYTLSFVLSAEKSEFKPESYTLNVDEHGITIRAGDTAGLYYGWKTLRQLMSKKQNKVHFPLCTIQDSPAFPIRGVMNDIGRNFMEIGMLKQTLDRMADYKLNVYHLHFTENPAFRFESKRYPQLNAAENMERSKGRYITQKELRDFILYARARNITVIPELDMPGHCAALRKAMKLDKMESEETTTIMCNLIDELCSVADSDLMPYLHIGTDEAHGANEKVSQATVERYLAAVRKNGRTPICWSPGLRAPGPAPLFQMWTGRRNPAPKGSKYIDSQETYINLADPFEIVSTIYFRKYCNFPNAEGVGGILCSWPDLPLQPEGENHMIKTPFYPAMVTFSNNLWRGKNTVDRVEFYTNLPRYNTADYQEFAAFEEKLLNHKERFFKNELFQYVKQTPIVWRLSRNGTELPDVYAGATVMYKHYCNYPSIGNNFTFNAPEKATYQAVGYIYSPKQQTVPFWVSGNTWSTSSRRGETSCIPGKWDMTDPTFKLNDKLIAAPEWKKPNLRGEGPLIDENYYFRAPVQLTLKKGWNKVEITSPLQPNRSRSMFTFVPLEQAGLKFAVTPNEK